MNLENLFNLDAQIYMHASKKHIDFKTEFFSFSKKCFNCFRKLSNSFNEYQMLKASTSQKNYNLSKSVI